MLLTSQSIIYERGDLLTKAYFPEAGAISLVVVFANGHTIETAMVGRDGMLGGLYQRGSRMLARMHDAETGRQGSSAYSPKG